MASISHKVERRACILYGASRTPNTLYTLSHKAYTLTGPNPALAFLYGAGPDMGCSMGLTFRGMIDRYFAMPSGLGPRFSGLGFQSFSRAFWVLFSRVYGLVDRCPIPV